MSINNYPSSHSNVKPLDLPDDNVQVPNESPSNTVQFNNSASFNPLPLNNLSSSPSSKSPLLTPKRAMGSKVAFLTSANSPLLRGSNPSISPSGSTSSQSRYFSRDEVPSGIVANNRSRWEEMTKDERERSSQGLHTLKKHNKQTGPSSRPSSIIFSDRLNSSEVENVDTHRITSNPQQSYSVNVSVTSSVSSSPSIKSRTNTLLSSQNVTNSPKQSHVDTAPLHLGRVPQTNEFNHKFNCSQRDCNYPVGDAYIGVDCQTECTIDNDMGVVLPITILSPDFAGPIELSRPDSVPTLVPSQPALVKSTPTTITPSLTPVAVPLQPSPTSSTVQGPTSTVPDQPGNTSQLITSSSMPNINIPLTSVLTDAATQSDSSLVPRSTSPLSASGDVPNQPVQLTHHNSEVVPEVSVIEVSEKKVQNKQQKQQQQQQDVLRRMVVPISPRQLPITTNSNQSSVPPQPPTPRRTLLSAPSHQTRQPITPLFKPPHHNSVYGGVGYNNTIPNTDNTPLHNDTAAFASDNFNSRSEASVGVGGVGMAINNVSPAMSNTSLYSTRSPQRHRVVPDSDMGSENDVNSDVNTNPQVVVGFPQRHQCINKQYSIIDLLNCNVTVLHPYWTHPPFIPQHKDLFIKKSLSDSTTLSTSSSQSMDSNVTNINKLSKTDPLTDTYIHKNTTGSLEKLSSTGLILRDSTLSASSVTSLNSVASASLFPNTDTSDCSDSNVQNNLARNSDSIIISSSKSGYHSPHDRMTRSECVAGCGSLCQESDHLSLSEIASLGYGYGDGSLQWTQVSPITHIMGANSGSAAYGVDFTRYSSVAVTSQILHNNPNILDEFKSSNLKKKASDSDSEDEDTLNSSSPQSHSGESASDHSIVPSSEDDGEEDDGDHMVTSLQTLLAYYANNECNTEWFEQVLNRSLEFHLETINNPATSRFSHKFLDFFENEHGSSNNSDCIVNVSSNSIDCPSTFNNSHNSTHTPSDSDHVDGDYVPLYVHSALCESFRSNAIQAWKNQHQTLLQPEHLLPNDDNLAEQDNSLSVEGDSSVNTASHVGTCSNANCIGVGCPNVVCDVLDVIYDPFVGDNITPAQQHTTSIPSPSIPLDKIVDNIENQSTEFNYTQIPNEVNNEVEKDIIEVDTSVPDFGTSIDNGVNIISTSLPNQVDTIVNNVSESHQRANVSTIVEITDSKPTILDRADTLPPHLNHRGSYQGQRYSTNYRDIDVEDEVDVGGAQCKMCDFTAASKIWCMGAIVGVLLANSTDHDRRSMAGNLGVRGVGAVAGDLYINGRALTALTSKKIDFTDVDNYIGDYRGDDNNANVSIDSNEVSLDNPSPNNSGSRENNVNPEVNDSSDETRICLGMSVNREGQVDVRINVGLEDTIVIDRDNGDSVLFCCSNSSHEQSDLETENSTKCSIKIDPYTNCLTITTTQYSTPKSNCISHMNVGTVVKEHIVSIQLASTSWMDGTSNSIDSWNLQHCPSVSQIRPHNVYLIYNKNANSSSNSLSSTIINSNSNTSQSLKSPNFSGSINNISNSFHEGKSKKSDKSESKVENSNINVKSESKDSLDTPLSNRDVTSSSIANDDQSQFGKTTSTPKLDTETTSKTEDGVMAESLISPSRSDLASSFTKLEITPANKTIDKSSTSSSITTPPTANITTTTSSAWVLQFPTDTSPFLTQIFSFLTLKELIYLSSTCKPLYIACKLALHTAYKQNLQQLWNTIGLNRQIKHPPSRSYFDCMHSLSLDFCNLISGDSLIDLLTHFYPAPPTTSQLLNLSLYYCFKLYDADLAIILERFSNLRILNIGRCFLLTPKLMENIAKLPYLQVLQMNYLPLLIPRALELLLDVNSFPHLKRLEIIGLDKHTVNDDVLRQISILRPKLTIKTKHNVAVTRKKETNTRKNRKKDFS